jgi:hypothetical protein
MVLLKLRARARQSEATAAVRLQVCQDQSFRRRTVSLLRSVLLQQILDKILLVEIGEILKFFSGAYESRWYPEFVLDRDHYPSLA